MPVDDLKTHAQSSEDFYALLEVEPTASQTEVRRAYRRTALKYHPDKHGGSTEAVDKFHQLQIAYDVLSDAEAKAIYDHARRAREEREQRNRALGDRKRKMVEDLERREGTWKKSRAEEEEEERAEAEARRLAADGARRRHELTEKRRRAAEEREREDLEGVTRMTGEANGDIDGQSYVPAEVADMDKAIKVRWRRQKEAALGEKPQLEAFFQRYGPVDGVVVFKDKKKRLDDADGKTAVATAAVAFESVAAAFAALEETEKHWADEFGDSLESVLWASGAEPACITQLRTATTPSTTATPNTLTPSEVTRIRLRIATQKHREIRAAREQEAREAAAAASAPAPAAEPERPAVRKIPSFASFKGTPQRPPPTKSFSPSPHISSPALAEMQRRKAERQALEAQIRLADEAEDAAQ